MKHTIKHSGRMATLCPNMSSVWFLLRSADHDSGFWFFGVGVLSVNQGLEFSLESLTNSNITPNTIPKYLAN